MLKRDYSGQVITGSSLATSSAFLASITNQICRIFKSKTRVWSQIMTPIPTYQEDKDFSDT